MGDSAGDTRASKNSGTDGAAKSTAGPVLPPFHHTEAFPDAASVFGMALAPLEEVKDRALVVLDTNVLLVPYTVNSKSLDAIRVTYQRLKAENRLFIPAQAAREFAIHRANKLGEIFVALTKVRNGLRAPDVGDYPLLADLDEYKQLAELHQQIRAKLDEYHKALGTVVDRVRAWRWDDPVSLLYRDLFTSEVVIEEPETRTEIEKFLAHRRANRLAPGYKDASKDDGGVGDALIWRTILHLGSARQQDLIFVSLDEKPDWWHRSEKTALYPRFDLANEYWRESRGCTFHQVRFSELLAVFQVPQDVVAEVRQEEAVTQVIPQQAALAGAGPTDDQSGHFISAGQAIGAVAHWVSRRFPGAGAMEMRTQFPNLIIHLPIGKRLGVDVKLFSPGGPRRLTSDIRQTVFGGLNVISAGAVDLVIGVLVAEDENEAIHAGNVAINRMHLDNVESTVNLIGFVSGYLDSAGRFIAVWEGMPRVIE